MLILSGICINLNQVNHLFIKKHYNELVKNNRNFVAQSLKNISIGYEICIS